MQFPRESALSGGPQRVLRLIRKWLMYAVKSI